jgi:hypothetical protein
MVTVAAFRKLALSLPNASESPHFARTSFRVKNKIFATMTKDGTEAMVRVKPMSRVKQLLSEQPDVFFDYGGWTWKNGAIGVRLSKVSAKQFRELVTASHAQISAKPKRKKMR